MRKFKNSKKLLPQASLELQQQVLKLQSAISAWLNWRCRNLSANVLMAMLITFCSISAVYLLLLILGNIS